MFLDSNLLITDCSSFLTEYFCTGNPVIHLISKFCNISPLPISNKIFDSFYKTYSFEDFVTYFENIIFNQNDYLKNIRNEILLETNFKFDSSNYIYKDKELSIVLNSSINYTLNFNFLEKTGPGETRTLTHRCARS